jgi:RNA polymerase sigma factor (sigma-70 family)
MTRLTDPQRDAVATHLGLAGRIAGEYMGRGLDFVDLVQAGALGIAEAVVRFEPHRGLKFSTYAEYWIRELMRQALRADRAIALPRLAHRRAAKVLHAQAADPGASVDELCDGLGITPRQRPVVKAALRLFVRREPEGMRSVAQTPPPRPDGTAALDRAVAALPADDRQLLACRYGLAGQPIQTRAAIAHRTGSRASQIRTREKHALRRLRASPHLQEYSS